MGKDKLDLNNLLAKYETGNHFYKSPSTNELANRKLDVQEQFYGKRTNQSNFFNNESRYNATNKAVQISYQPRRQIVQQNIKLVGNFQMSKQQCRDFLQSIKSVLHRQRQSYEQYPSIVLRQIKQTFSRKYNELKQQIQRALDQAFKQNYKKIQEQLHRNANKRPIQFDHINKQIKQIQEQISRFLQMLSHSNTYRQAISKVVLKDYTTTIKYLDENIQIAKHEYKSGLGQVQPDKTRIQCLYNDLSRLFYFRKKQGKVIEKSIFSVLGGGNTMSPQKNKMDYGGMEPIQKEASRTRKTFFNFGN